VGSVTPLEHALRLARNGHAVFPCKNAPGDKEQHKTPHTPNGFHDASRNPELITTWFEKRFPEALVGVPMGDKLCALDVDLQHASAQAWCEQNKDRMPNGRIHHTQSGGRHYFMREHPDIRCWKGILGVKGVDTRGRASTGGPGGYVIWWAAHGYPVENPDAPCDAPEWLTEALRPPPPQPRRTFIPREDDDERITSALQAICPDDYDTWLHVGMALKDHYGANGFDLWDRWASQSESYRSRRQPMVWGSFRRSGRSIGTVFHYARQAGWRPPPPPDRDAWRACGLLISRLSPITAFDLFLKWCSEQSIARDRAEEIFGAIAQKELRK
jgi:hypothetical protein